jgi:hypothetical protein
MAISINGTPANMKEFSKKLDKVNKGNKIIEENMLELLKEFNKEWVLKNVEEICANTRDVDEVCMALEHSTIFATEMIQDLTKTILDLQQELSTERKKLKKIEEYLTSYESISTIQGFNDTKENKNLDKNTMVEMTNRYLKVHDKILSIIKGGKE